MEEYLDLLARVPLFAHIERTEIKAMLGCLCAEVRHCGQGTYIAHAGDPAGMIGVVLHGTVHVFCDDYSGRRNLTVSLAEGKLFAETFACAGIPLLPVDIMAYTDAAVLLIGIDRVLNQCSNACEFHSRLTQNLLGVIARKNMALNRRLGYLSCKTTAEKLMAYLNDQAGLQQSAEFDIPYDRQSLADYLGVERSAMSAEIGKLQKRGRISTVRNHFVMLTQPEDGSQIVSEPEAITVLTSGFALA